MQIAFIGIGDMGSEMVPHLLKAKHQVKIWDRDKQRVSDFKENFPDAQVAESLEATIKGTKLVITSVMSDNVLDLHLGSSTQKGIVDYLEPDSILVVTSTLDPEKIMKISKVMPKNTKLFDVPMIGGVRYAREAGLVFIVGGTQAEFSEIEPVFSLMGKIKYAGELGNGAKLKLITNVGIMAAEAGIRETLDLADAYGIDYGLTLDLMKMGPLNAVVTRALDETNPRSLKDSVADVDELVKATEKIVSLPIVENSRKRLQKAVDITNGDAKFIDITHKNTSLPDYQ